MRGNDRGKKHGITELQQEATSDLGNNIQLNSLWAPPSGTGGKEPACNAGDLG